MLSRAALAVLLALTLAAGARAGTLERVRAQGVVTCGSPVRPGLAVRAVDGTWHGLHVDLCRAVAAAVLGDPGRISFRPYLTPAGFDALRDGRDELGFLTAAEMIDARLPERVAPGPPVFFLAHAVMVPASSPVRGLGDLGAATVCVEPGTGAERSLEAFARGRGLALHPFGLQEEEERVDAYASGRCGAIADEVTSLAVIRLQAAAAGRESRILPEPISALPVFAVTGTGDGAWAATVAWTVHALMRAEQQGRPGPGGGPEPLPIAAPALGLLPGWQERLRRTLGTYADLYRADLGEGSPLDLPRGLNAGWDEGGLLLPPYSD